MSCRGRRHRARAVAASNKRRDNRLMRSVPNHFAQSADPVAAPPPNQFTPALVARCVDRGVRSRNHPSCRLRYISAGAR
jgi:hypothetical protein